MTEKSQEVAAEITAYLRARNPLIWCVTGEEARAEAYLFEAAAASGYLARTWDVANGVQTMAGKPDTASDLNPQETQDASAALNVILKRAQRGVGASNNRGVWIMRDLPPWLEGPIGMQPLRLLRNLARFLPTAPRDSAQAIIIISPRNDVPVELRNHATVVDWPLPDRAEIGRILDSAVRSVIRAIDKTVADADEDTEIEAAIGRFLNGAREPAIDAAVGLSGEEAAACYSRSLVQRKAIDPATVSREKKRVIAREKVLEWIDPLPGGLDAVGGLDLLKSWLVGRRMAYSAKAREYGLPAPKGALLVGIPGCGKSLCAKAIATAWSVPLLRLDLNALKSKFVGESEQNIRRAFSTIEAIGRCVVWVDEIEKALAGATDGGADGGVSTDALGAVLSWMQERQGEAFVIATANDVSGLPPELLRKGRFDELWWVDLPVATERVQILSAALKANGRSLTTIDANGIADVVRATEGFTGAEIAALVPDALFTAFADDAREITIADLLKAAKTIVPLSKTAKEKLDKLRTWATERARFATSEQAAIPQATARQGGRELDL